jgi:hypothetical protein
MIPRQGEGGHDQLLGKARTELQHEERATQVSIEGEHHPGYVAEDTTRNVEGRLEIMATRNGDG